MVLSGSASRSKMRAPAAAAAAARFIDVVVFPTPLFWLATKSLRTVFSNYNRTPAWASLAPMSGPRLLLAPIPIFRPFVKHRARRSPRGLQRAGSEQFFKDYSAASNPSCRLKDEIASDFWASFRAHCEPGGLAARTSGFRRRHGRNGRSHPQTAN